MFKSFLFWTPIKMSIYLLCVYELFQIDFVSADVFATISANPSSVNLVLVFFLLPCFFGLPWAILVPKWRAPGILSLYDMFSRLLWNAWCSATISWLHHQSPFPNVLWFNFGLYCKYLLISFLTLNLHFVQQNTLTSSQPK